MTLLGWKVSGADDPYGPSTDDGGTAVLVQAATRAEALRQGASDLNADSADCLAERVPELDELDADDFVRGQMALGWGLPCEYCHSIVYEGWTDGEDEEEEADLSFSRRWLVRRGALYCSTQCCLQQLRDQRSYRENEWNVVAEAVARWPGIEIVDADGLTFGEGDYSRQVVGHVRFRFPGGHGQVHWTRYSPTVAVERRDLAAWEQFAAACKG